MDPGLETVSDIFGWTYTITWGISFYGQIWEVWKLKNCEGLTLDYVLLNEIGYIMYSFYNSFGYFDENSGIHNVDVQDLIFCYHGLIMNSILVAMCCYYPRGENKFSLWAKILSATLIIYSCIYALLTNGLDLFSTPSGLSTLDLLGYNKLLITLVKYSPQVYWNYKRQSTLGWNIFNVLCDFSGGFFSFAQNTVDAIGGDTDFIGGVNTAKFMLGIITMVYDVTFIIQHYCLYRQNTLRLYKEEMEKQEREQLEQKETDLYKIDLNIKSEEGQSLTFNKSSLASNGASNSRHRISSAKNNDHYHNFVNEDNSQ